MLCIFICTFTLDWMKIVLDVNSNLLSVGFTFAKSTTSHKSANKTRSSVDRNEQDAEDTINREKFWKILKQRYSSLISKRKIIIFCLLRLAIMIRVLLPLRQKISEVEVSTSDRSTFSSIFFVVCSPCLNFVGLAYYSDPGYSFVRQFYSIIVIKNLLFRN